MSRSRTDDKMGALSTLGLFANCNNKELHAVAGLCMPLGIKKGFVLTAEGTPGQECFVIADGDARVTIGDRLVGVVGSGDCVGEVAILDGGCRTATVTAETPMNAYVFSRGEFWSMLDVSPTAARQVVVRLARRLRAVEANNSH